MGCGSSSKPVSDGEPADEKIQRSTELFDLIVNAKSPHIRLDTSEVMKKFHIEGAVFEYDIEYCYVSQRGYYPNCMSKDCIIMFIMALGSYCNLFL